MASHFLRSGVSAEEAWESRENLVAIGMLVCHRPGLPIGTPGWQDDGGSYSLGLPPGSDPAFIASYDQALAADAEARSRTSS